MSINAPWWVFADAVIDSDRDSPGVYELGNAAGEVIYIGSADELRRRLKEHWHEPETTCLKKNTTQYRLEYTPDYLAEERQLYEQHMRVYGKPPLCNEERHAQPS